MNAFFQAENHTLKRVFSVWRITGSVVPGKIAGCDHLICHLCQAVEAQEGGVNTITLPALFKAERDHTGGNLTNSE